MTDICIQRPRRHIWFTTLIYFAVAESGDGVDAALTLAASRYAILVVSKYKLKERASMGEVSIIGVDLAKNVFQVHGAAADGSVLFRKKLSRPQFAQFMVDQSPCLVAMEACAGAHHWAREMSRYGHEVRLIAPHYVKPFLKRQKNDVADAEAIVEAALRSHLYEFGHVAPEGIGYLPRLAKVVDDPDSDVPELARDICRMLLEQIAQLTARIDALKARIAAMSQEADLPRQLQTMPGVGPITALAVETFAPPMEQFRRGRDFAAWLGPVLRQHSSGGKQKLGKTSKMGQRDIRRLLVIGATAVIRWASRRGAPKGSWLARMLERKPVPVAATALANKMARGIWAMLTRGESYRGPVLIGA